MPACVFLHHRQVWVSRLDSFFQKATSAYSHYHGGCFRFRLWVWYVLHCIPSVIPLSIHLLFIHPSIHFTYPSIHRSGNCPCIRPLHTVFEHSYGGDFLQRALDRVLI